MTEPKHIHELGPVILCSEVYAEHAGQVLMNRRSPNKRRFPGFLIGPGGRIDEGEDPVTAGVREVYEESGIRIAKADMHLRAIGLHYHLDHQETWVNFIYHAKLDKVDGLLHNTADGESLWVPVEELFSNSHIFPPSQYYFEHIFRGPAAILNVFSEWRDSQLVRVVSEHLEPQA